MSEMLKKHQRTIPGVINTWFDSMDEPNNASRVFFESMDALYSYGKHFPLAVRLVHDTGLLMIVAQDVKVSSSTTQHMGIARKAAESKLAFDQYVYVYDRIPENWAELYKDKPWELERVLLMSMLTRATFECDSIAKELNDDKLKERTERTLNIFRDMIELTNFFDGVPEVSKRRNPELDKSNKQRLMGMCSKAINAFHKEPNQEQREVASDLDYELNVLYDAIEDEGLLS